MDKEDNKVFPNFYNQLLYVETKISSSDLKELKNKAKDCLENQNNFKSANEYENLNNKIRSKLINQIPKKQVSSWASTGSWINFQKKHEFNPRHFHTGNYSFVLWIQIPYDLEEELKLANCVNTKLKHNSLFCFSYLNRFGNTVDNPLLIDKTWEGTMILFPSNLEHQVYPFFTSDDYRISISGNLIEKTLEPKKTFSYQ